ncbi:histidine phosphatase family protein [Streptomyces sp. NPDC018031]|uniref:histidine phosphatase family protein n=1 Tax=Streptomyces sp. NPDC018031 TaxID=3365033 RepID=UPI0037A8BC09
MVHEQDSVTHLLLVRHAQSHASVKKLIAGSRTCLGLTELGHEQVTRLADRLRAEQLRPDALLTSPVRRARETADGLARGLGLGEPVVEEQVRELDFGVADGLSIDEYSRVHGDFDMTANPERPFAPGGESWSRFRVRAGDVMRGLAKLHAGERVLVVCHAGFIVAAMAAVLDVPPPVLFTDATPAATSINEFAHDGSGWRLVRFDDAAHIGTPAPAEGTG